MSKSISALALTVMLTPALALSQTPLVAPAIDPDMQEVLTELNELGAKPLETLTTSEARRNPTVAAALLEVLDNHDMKAPYGDVQTDDISVEGAAGSLDARVYRPAGVDDETVLPVILYFHGGGWVIADIDTYDAAPRALAAMTGAMVISTEYRQAPEDKFPAAHDDAVAVYRWVLANAAKHGGDAARIAVVGESAGANLALNVAIAARDQKLQMPLREVLVYPVAGTNMETPSYNEHATAKPLGKEAMGWFMGHVVTSDKDKTDPRLDVVGRANLTGLPPTTIILAEIDPLRSEGEALGTKLREAGVDVHTQTYAGVTHEFFGLGAVVADAKAAEMLAADDLKKSLMPVATK